MGQKEEAAPYLKRGEKNKKNEGEKRSEFAISNNFSFLFPNTR